MQDFFSGQFENFPEGRDSSDGETNFSSCFDLASSSVPQDEFIAFDEVPPAEEIVAISRSDSEKAFDSIILSMMQFFDVEDIHYAIKKPKPSIRDICFRIEQLLYNPADASEALKNAQKLVRFRQRRTDFSPFERFWLLYVSLRFPKTPVEDILATHRHMLWGGHKQEEINEEFQEICRLDEAGRNSILADLANEFAVLESHFTDQMFTDDDLDKAGVTHQDLEWWMNWVKESREYNSQPEAHIGKIRPMLSNVRDMEHECSFLLQNRQWNKTSLARLQSFDIKWDISRKVTVIGDADRSLDVNLCDWKHYEKAERDMLAVIELSPDLWFYIENCGEVAFRVNGVVISPGESTYINDMWLIEMNNIDLMFTVNPVVWGQILQMMKGKRLSLGGDQDEDVSRAMRVPEETGEEQDGAKLLLYV